MTTIIDAGDPRAAAATDAVQQGDIAWLRQLLADHPELATAAFGTAGPGGMTRTLLHAATDWPGHRPNVAATIQVLVDAGADVNARFTGPHTETPLHWAASSDDVEALDALLDAGADIEADGAVIAGGTPLDDAVAFGQWQAAWRLVERAELNWIAPWGGLTPLDAARRSDAHGLAPWLVARGAQSATEPTGTKD